MSFQQSSTNQRFMWHCDTWSGWNQFAQQCVQFQDEDCDRDDKILIGNITILYLFDGAQGTINGLYDVSRDYVCYLMNRCDYKIFSEIYDANKRAFFSIGTYIIATQQLQIRRRQLIAECHGDEDTRLRDALQIADDRAETRYVQVNDHDGRLRRGENILLNWNLLQLVEGLEGLRLRGLRAERRQSEIIEDVNQYKIARQLRIDNMRKAEEAAAAARAKQNADELSQREKDEEDEEEARKLEAMKPKEVKAKKDKPKKAPKNPFPEEIRISEGIWKKNPKWVKWEKENK